MTPTRPAASFTIACAAALAAFAGSAQAADFSLLEDFNSGSPSYLRSGSFDYHPDGGDGYIRLYEPVSFGFQSTTALSSLTLSFSYTSCAWSAGACKTGAFDAATVSLNGPASGTAPGASLLSTALPGTVSNNPNPGPASTQFFRTFSDLAAGDYTLSFTPISGVIFKLDDIAINGVSAVPEPASVALMLAGLGVVGLAARRRKASGIAAA